LKQIFFGKFSPPFDIDRRYPRNYPRPEITPTTDPNDSQISATILQEE